MAKNCFGRTLESCQRRSATVELSWYKLVVDVGIKGLSSSLASNRNLARTFINRLFLLFISLVILLTSPILRLRTDNTGSSHNLEAGNRPRLLSATAAAISGSYRVLQNDDSRSGGKFCRSLVGRKNQGGSTCRSDMPTVDYLDINKLQGRWFEIGRTVHSKVAAEWQQGTACNEMNLTRHGIWEGKRELLGLFQGVRIVDRNRTLKVAQMDRHVAGIAIHLRSICQHVAFSYSSASVGFSALKIASLSRRSVISSEIAETVANSTDSLLATLDKIDGRLADIFSSLELIQQALASLDVLSGEEGEIVRERNKLVQKHAWSIKLQGDANSFEWKRVMNWMQKTRALLPTLLSSQEGDGGTSESERVVKLILRNVGEVQALLAPQGSVYLDGKAVVLAASTIAKISAAMPLSSSVSPRKFSIPGVILQNPKSRGRFVSFINSKWSRFWVVGLRIDSSGEYTMMVIYSCNEQTSHSSWRLPNEPSMFIYARIPLVRLGEIRSIVKFLRREGMVLKGDNPFIQTSWNTKHCKSV